MKKVFKLLATTLLMAANLTASDFEEKKIKAEQGDAEAQNYIGFMYYKGNGVPQDYTKALYWLNKAAKQGHPHAQYYVGCMYFNGNGVNEDLETAAIWIKKAAEQGRSDAQFSTYQVYAHGIGVPQDSAEAIRWLKEAAKQGETKAQHELGLAYNNGEGVPQDYAKAIELYTKAADRGFILSQNNLGNIYYKGNGVAQDYKEAAKWYKKAARQGDMNAQYMLGMIYQKSQGVPRDYEEARKWHKKAAVQGWAESQYWLGIMYNQGEGAARNHKEALKWFKKASDRGHALAREQCEHIEAAVNLASQCNVPEMMKLSPENRAFLVSSAKFNAEVGIGRQYIAKQVRNYTQHLLSGKSITQELNGVTTVYKEPPSSCITLNADVPPTDTAELQKFREQYTSSMSPPPNMDAVSAHIWGNLQDAISRGDKDEVEKLAQLFGKSMSDHNSIFNQGTSGSSMSAADVATPPAAPETSLSIDDLDLTGIEKLSEEGQQIVLNKIRKVLTEFPSRPDYVQQRASYYIMIQRSDDKRTRQLASDMKQSLSRIAEAENSRKHAQEERVQAFIDSCASQLPEIIEELSADPVVYTSREFPDPDLSAEFLGPHLQKVRELCNEEDWLGLNDYFECHYEFNRLIREIKRARTHIQINTTATVGNINDNSINAVVLLQLDHNKMGDDPHWQEGVEDGTYVQPYPEGGYAALIAVPGNKAVLQRLFEWAREHPYHPTPFTDRSSNVRSSQINSMFYGNRLIMSMIGKARMRVRSQIEASEEKIKASYISGEITEEQSKSKILSLGQKRLELYQALIPRMVEDWQETMDQREQSLMTEDGLEENLSELKVRPFEYQKLAIMGFVMGETVAETRTRLIGHSIRNGYNPTNIYEAFTPPLSLGNYDYLFDMRDSSWPDKYRESQGSLKLSQNIPLAYALGPDYSIKVHGPAARVHDIQFRPEYAKSSVVKNSVLKIVGGRLAGLRLRGEINGKIFDAVAEKYGGTEKADFVDGNFTTKGCSFGSGSDEILMLHIYHNPIGSRERNSDLWLLHAGYLRSVMDSLIADAERSATQEKGAEKALLDAL